MNTKLNIESIIDGSIEKIKLAKSVQESLNKADNAIQSTDVKTLELSDKNIKRLDVANGTTDNYLTALDEATSPLHSANRLQFINPNGMIVEYSTDGGSTWVDYEISDADKILLTSGKGTILIAGKGLSETASSSDLLRITLNAADLGVYTSAKLLLINFSTNGSRGCILDIETAYRGTETNFSLWKQGLEMKGWSGWNRIPLNMLFGGDSTQTSQIGAIRLTFSSSGATSGTGQHFKVLDLQLFGSSYWRTPSTMAKTGHLYDYNSSQTMILPQSLWPKTNGVGDIGASNYYWNNVYSNNFIKKNSSNDYVLLGGGGHKKLSDIKNEINHLVGKGAQNNALLRDLTSNPQDTTLYTGGWNTGSLTGKTYATDYGTTLDISYSTWYQRLGFNTSKGNSNKPRIEYFQGINTSDGSLTKIGDLAYLSDVYELADSSIQLSDLEYFKLPGNLTRYRDSNSTIVLSGEDCSSLIEAIINKKRIVVQGDSGELYPVTYTTDNIGTSYTGKITFIAENVMYILKCLSITGYPNYKSSVSIDKRILEEKITYVLEFSLGELILNNICTFDNTGLVNAINNGNIILVKDGIVNGAPVIRAAFDSATKMVSFSYFGDENKFFKFNYIYDPDNNINNNTLPLDSMSVGIDKKMLSTELVNELKPYVLSFSLENLNTIATSQIEINITELYNVIRNHQPIIIKNSTIDYGGVLVSGLIENLDDGETAHINLSIYTSTDIWKINGLVFDNTIPDVQTYTITSSNVTKYSLPNLSSGSADLLAKNNLKTINGTSIYKEHNVSGNIYTYYPSSTVTRPNVTITISPNTFYKFGTSTTPLTNIGITLGSEISSVVVNEYVFEIYTTTVVPTLSLTPRNSTDTIKWVSGNAPVLEENKIYQISIINNLATVLSWDNA